MCYAVNTVTRRTDIIKILRERKRNMAWKLDSDKPIYLQLVEQIQMQIVSGQYAPGTKLPSVRELASVAAVNPNTLQKAFTELERNGLVITQRTSGRNVTEDETLINEIRRKLARENTEEYYSKMQKLGYTKQEVIDFLSQSLA